jgi:thymidine kinase
MAEGILKKCGFSKENIDVILIAIEGHRKNEGFSIVGKLLYKADKLSRNCVSCKARSTCKKFQNHENPFLQYYSFLLFK